MEELKYFLLEYPALPALITAIVLFITLIIQTWNFVQEGQRREEEKNIQLASEAIDRYEKYVNKKFDFSNSFNELNNHSPDLESAIYRLVNKTIENRKSYYEIRSNCFPILKK